METTQPALDPHTMATVTQILLEQHMRAYYVEGNATPERMATMDCLTAQVNYWKAR